ncbi:hypothetical protein N8H74_27150 [Pseudomonas sp. B2M1-30]|uniref:hypothetical protein n=1 Tax=Pseudomonas TaxID=286 RepID=UPI0021C75130|nr:MULTISPECIES: hypothetical protein [Pseudomonas]MCU0121951.1 hypothetical protein [Pseudomonas sp. B2M1-30]MCU7264072.1 hypothetical protein [Pseudomonas koreensis]
MRYRNAFNRLAHSLIIGLGAIGATGCSVAQQDSFTLVTELPPGFQIRGEAQYVPRAGETCSAPVKKGREHPGFKFFKQEMNEKAQTAEFQVPLTSVEGGCPLVLDSFDYEVDAKYGASFRNVGRDYTGIAFQEGAVNSGSAPSPLSLQRECEWLFRTAGPQRYITKILKCAPVATPEQENGTVAKGALQRAQLQGKTLKVSFLVAREEKPAVGDNWVKFPNGWKRCMGKSLEDPFAFCRGNTTDFKPFKMPDGRDCTIYPTCTE